MLLEYCLNKELCLTNAQLKTYEKMKVTFKIGENGKKIDFVLIKKEH